MHESQILLFILSSLAVIFIPGQDMMIVISRAIASGKKAGAITALGVSVGLLGHTLLVTFGIGGILMSSELFFYALKYLGGAYLLYLGVKLMVSDSRLKLQDAKPQSSKKLFTEGVLSNVFNPKVSLFYIAFLPQFISVDNQQPIFYLLALGLSFSLLSLFIKISIALLVGSVSTWMNSHPMVIQRLNRVSGMVLILLGVKLAFEQR